MRAEYEFGEFIINGFSLICTKLFWKNARLIRYPFYCRGKKYFSYGKALTVGYRCRFETFQVDKINKHGKIIVGQNCKFGDHVHITSCEEVRIGNNCLCASNVLISDNEHGYYSIKNNENLSSPYEKPDKRKIYTKKILIGNNVWIGENVVILPGAIIEDGCVVGANSVVKKYFKKNSIIAGVPATVIKEWNDKNGWTRKILENY